MGKSRAIAFKADADRIPEIPSEYEYAINLIRKNITTNCDYRVMSTLLEIENLLKLLKEYESISIGIDVGKNDNTAILIAQTSEKGEVYILKGRTYYEGQEDYFKLKDLIELKNKEMKLRGKI